MATTKAGQKAVNKYIKKNYMRIGYVIPHEFGAQLKAAAAAENLSVTAYISKAVRAYMDENGK